jgi:hypothetical protein
MRRFKSATPIRPKQPFNFLAMDRHVFSESSSNEKRGEL